MFSKLNSINTNRISFRLTVGYAVLCILTSFFVLFLNYFLFSQSIKSRDQDILYSKSKEYSSKYQADGLTNLKKYLDEEKLGDSDSQYLVRIGSIDSKTIFLHVPEKMKMLPVSNIEQKLRVVGFKNKISSLYLKEDSVDDPNEENEYEVASQPLLAGEYLQVARNTDDRDDLLVRYLRIILLISVIILIIGILGGYIFSKQALSPLRNLIQAIKLVRSGTLSARVPVRNTNDELDEISLLFNMMAEKIERLILNMQETLDSVAHDLRTPLTRLKSKAELVLLNPATEEDYRATLVNTIENTTEIVNFINTLMDISEAEAGVLKLNLAKVNSKNIILEVLDLYLIIAEEKNISIEFIDTDTFYFFADKIRYKQVLSNLIDNAIKYSVKNSHIKITTRLRNEFGEINIVDEGIGISEYDLPKIWDRLFRANESKSVKGLGLGLSLAQSICSAHGWDISVQSQFGIGSEFTVSMKTSN